jgi:hypothetical protein
MLESRQTTGKNLVRERAIKANRVGINVAAPAAEVPMVD